MKTIIIFLSIIITSSILYSQSTLVYDSGTFIDVGLGADVCADTIIVNGTHIGSGTFCGGSLSVKNGVDLGTPTEFSLSQNYPNPFNPSTTISYQLVKQSHVTLKVFDVLGREVATLVNGLEEPGYKSVKFEASKLPSGVYYYRLQAGNYVETKKLLLLR